MTHSRHRERCETPLNIHLACCTSGTAVCFFLWPISPDSAGQELHNSPSHSKMKDDGAFWSPCLKAAANGSSEDHQNWLQPFKAAKWTERHLLAAADRRTSNKDSIVYRQYVYNSLHPPNKADYKQRHIASTIGYYWWPNKEMLLPFRLVRKTVFNEKFHSASSIRQIN